MTTIAIDVKLKAELDAMRIADGETMNSVVHRLMNRAKGIE